MKRNLHSFFCASFAIVLIFSIQLLVPRQLHAQIYEPEGLNMPGAWNTWTNPPANNLALANPNQVPGGRLVKITSGKTRWQTIFSVAPTGADLIGGTYEWLFTSGPSTNYFQNKWSNVAVTVNTLQNYTKEGPDNNTVSLTDGKWYTVNWEDLGYMDSRAIFMETSAEPVAITYVSEPAAVFENQAVEIQVTIEDTPSAEELFYLCYTTNNWVSSQVVPVSFTGLNGTATIPGQPLNTGVSYFVMSSTIAALSADFDLCSIRQNNNGGSYYSYAIGTPPPPVITWANLQWPESGEIETGTAYDVYGQVFIQGVTGQSVPDPGLEAWIGYSTSDTDPATWTDWVAADFNVSSGSNDEYSGDIGSVIASEGTYYYATRFRYEDGDYVYGGFNGGFWDGTTNISGVLTVSDVIQPADFDWLNLQYPGSAGIEPGENLDVYAQAYIEGVTGQPTAAPGVQAWIGYSTTDTDPSGWTDWFPALFNGPSGNNDEYIANLGQYLTSEGTYYYASRFQRDEGSYYYGGFSETGGGFWDGINNVSGILTVQSVNPDPQIGWANLQYPQSGEIEIGQAYDVYAQAWIDGITGQSTQAPGLEAWIGYSPNNTDPAEWTDWVPADFNAPSGNNDEFIADLGAQFSQTGVWYYASRFRYNSGDFVYGGFSQTGGGFWDGTENVSGMLTVTEPQQTFPVLFTIIDATGLHDAIKLKGDMTNWDTIAMNPDNHVWTLTLDMVPGTYEWGAIEDDGTQFGLWLIEGGNLVMTLGEDGSISGTVTYTTLVTSTTDLPAGSVIYPNPVDRMLYVKVPGMTTISIYDMSGKQVSVPVTAMGETQVDFGLMKPGMYQLAIRTGDSVYCRKIIRK